jgi:hypothetical protein
MIVEDFMTRRVIAVGANDSIVEAANQTDVEA